MKSLGVYYWYVKMPRYFLLYVQKHIAHLAACSGALVGSQRAARGTRISETRLFSYHSVTQRSSVIYTRLSNMF